MPFEHLLCYQHNVQAFLLGHLDKYQGIVVPLSVATAFKEGTDGFIRALCKASPEKVYMIDPRSALFQDKWDRKNTRDAHRRMAAQLGKIALSTLEAGRAIAVEDLTDEAVRDMVETCLTFQLDFGQRDNAKLKKYAKLAGVASLGVLESPRRLLPPYFEFTGTGDPWYQKNIALIAESQGLLKKKDPALLTELCPILHVHEFAEAVDWAGIASDLVKRDIRAAFLYPNNFREIDATEGHLQRYKSAVQELSKVAINCYSLHGGYFAVMLSKHGLSGFGNGVGYGEWRDSGYHRGGQANVRIYVPKLHRFVQANDIQNLFEAFGDFIAEDSDLLLGILSSGGSALAVTTEQANNHFLACRSAEINFVAKSGLPEIRAELASTAQILAKCESNAAQQFSADVSKSLARWAQAI